MKIKQLTSYPNPNELGLGNTNETYIRIENSLDVSDMFPVNMEVPIYDSKIGKSYNVKAASGTEFRINKMGQLYRDYNVRPGDEIKFTYIEWKGQSTIYFTVTNYKRTFLSVSAKGTEIVSIENLAPFAVNLLQKEYNVPISQGTLVLKYEKSEKKRADSPNETEFFSSLVNNVAISKGNYYVTILEGSNILEEVKKNIVEEYSLPEHLSSNVVCSDLCLPLQQIFYGAPGTGKSFTIDKDTNENNRIRTTFHPDYDYAAFVGAYKPTAKQVDKYGLFGKDTVTLKHEDDTPIKEDVIVYKFVPQSFTKAYVEAWRRFADANRQDKNYYFVIEEINRGNCAQIFGDLFQLLDRTRGGYSSYAVETDTDLQQFLATDETWRLNITLTEDIKNDEGRVIAKAEDVMSGKVLVLPPNLHIWATMNTSDQSLFPIDSAFKRRWEWKYVPIKYENINWKVVLTDKSWCSWTELQTTLNDLIYEATESEDKMLGDWFVKADDEDIITEEQLVGKIIFYLWNDVAKVDAGTLFDLEVEKKRGRNKAVTFSDFYKLDGKTDTTIVKEWLTKIGITINEPEVDPETIVGTDTSVSVPTKPEYQRLFDVLKAKCEENGIKYKSFSNSINMAIGEYAFSKLMIAVALDNTGTPNADIKLWIEATSNAIATRDTLRSNGAGAFFEELAQESDKLSWEEIAKDVPDTENKVRGWRLRNTAITFDKANVAEEAEWIFAKVQQIRKRFANVL